ncbi:DUF4192 family protein [Demequina mangrovi]|uniref:DUF4192 domain-containing protein n=1 Tax=Demequina mangrovi TaxID=1043493 RepID=A0A1H6UAZ8_9MICO|nr:DUF4192 family protein [Demequina mangrovi]SEI89481.1 protein of unknown function [Demequina mangrovi]
MTTITGPGQLATLVPTLLGFAPLESVVAVLVRERGELGAILRLDERELLGDAGADAAQALSVAAMREGARSAIVLAYTRDAAAGCAALDVAVAGLEETVATVDPWVVAEGRYFCPRCEDPRCCPPGGRPLPSLDAPGPGAVRVRRDPGVSRAPAAQRRLASRAARRWEERAGSDRTAWRAASARRWSAALDGDEPGAAQLGALGAALADVRVRDAVLLMLIPGAERAVEDALAGIDSSAVARAFDAGLTPATPPCEPRVDQARRVLLSVLEHAPMRCCAAAAGTLAVIAWWSSAVDVARAWCAIALDHDPEYRLALLVLALIETAPQET